MINQVLPADLDIDGDLSVTNNAEFDINFRNANVAGNWNDAGGTFQAADGVVTLWLPKQLQLAGPTIFELWLAAQVL